MSDVAGYFSWRSSMPIEETTELFEKLLATVERNDSPYDATDPRECLIYGLVCGVELAMVNEDILNSFRATANAEPPSYN
jgi:hypothetical protein